MIVCADIRNVLKDTPDKMYDAVISDPPYCQEAHGRGFAGKREIYTAMAEWTNLNNDWYSTEILSEFVRICKFPNIFLFGGKRDIYKMLKFAEDNNLEYWIIPICKKCPIPMTNNTWLSNEYAVHITDRRLVYSREYKHKIPYFIVGGQKETKHPNEKNLDMMKRIILNITPPEGIVFDGFVGSGTTALACQQTGRKFFGCDINENFCNLAWKRLEDDKRQQSLF